MSEPGASIRVERGGPLAGTLRVPGDKSLTHRALIFAALAEGVSHIEGALDAHDTRATADALAALGTRIDWPAGSTVKVVGTGGRFRTSEAPLDLGNSGTGLRLLAGALAGRDVNVILDGDVSLRKRPMARITAPLRAMGAEVTTRDGCAPIAIHPRPSLQGMTYRLPVGSAQVKSAVLLAGLAAEGPTRVIDPFHSRDHTERLLPRFGARLSVEGDAIALEPGPLAGTRIAIPADASSAAFPSAAALLVPGSRLTLPGVGRNPTRTGFFALLERMGAEISWHNERMSSGEPVANLEVRATKLVGIRVEAHEVPAAIDELPLLMMLAATATGETVINGAGELRHKESDRIEAMRAGLAVLGAYMSVEGDCMTVSGGGFQRGGRLEASGDHRVAMSLALAGLATPEPVTVTGAEWIEISFPGFAALMRRVGANMREVA
jgi:3-phosphoshikimate 1-carboxyvinyltransferase